MILNWPFITKTVPILCNLSLFRSPKCNCKLLTFVVWKYLMLVTKKSNLNLGMTKESTFNSHRAGSRWWNLKFVNFYIGHSISDLVHQLLYSQQIEFSMTNRLIGSRAFVWKIGGLNAVLKLCTLNTLTFHLPHFNQLMSMVIVDSLLVYYRYTTVCAKSLGALN